MGRESLKKKLYSQGKYVGDVELTGDQKEDVQIVNEYLDERGLRKPPSKINAMYAQATAFSKTASYVYEQSLLKRPVDPLGVSPFIVNGVFSAEMYLKTLLEIYKKNEHGHNLSALFKQLPNKVKDKINKKKLRFEAKYGVQSGIPFIKHIKECANAFVDWRYMYEKSELHFDVQKIIFILHTLHEVCNEEMETLKSTENN